MMRSIIALAAALLPAGASDTDIPAEFGLVEGIAYDARSGQMFAGSVEKGALLVREGERWRQAVLPYSTGGLFGMALDRHEGVLWIAIGTAPPAKRGAGFRGIIGVTTQGFEPAGRASVPAGDAAAQPGDVAVGPDGSVFVSDGAAGNVYVCRPGCTELVKLLPAGSFGSAQGLAVSRDGKRLYVADYATGIHELEIKRPAKRRLLAPIRGVDGLVRDGDALIAIVNGDGRKIVRLTIDPAGAASQQLLATPPGPGDPTLGTVVGERLIYVADAQWDRFTRNGASKAEARATPIRSLALPAGPRPPEKIRVRDGDRPGRRREG